MTLPPRITGLKARYVHGVGRNTKMFHLINLDKVSTWATHNRGWALLTVYTSCGQREQLTSTPVGDSHNSMTLAVDPPKGLKPCPRCFERWEKLGKPLTAEQWRERTKALRVMTGYATRAKKG